VILMEIYVGTSGWLYDWNEDGTLDWFVENSGLNAIELNASFYRFPYKNQVISWSRRGSSLRWAIKVHRSITHLRKLSSDAINTWFNFRELFKPMDSIIDFYLFQLPPNYTCREENLRKIKSFYEETGLGERFALEFRHQSCFNKDVVDWFSKLGLTIVSIDAPIANWIVRSNRNIYLRLHGREYWYGYEYSFNELEEIANKLFESGADRIYVFFNNNHWMLDNARVLKNILMSRIAD